MALPNPTHTAPYTLQTTIIQSFIGVYINQAGRNTDTHTNTQMYTHTQTCTHTHTNNSASFSPRGS